MSEDMLKKITLEINKHESLEDKELKIIRFQLLKKSNILKVILRGKERLAIEEEELIKKIICKTLMIRITVEIIFYRDASNISLEEVVESHWLECISDTVKKTPLCKTLLLSSKRIVEGNKVIVLNGYDKVTDHLKSKCGEKSIEGSIEAIFGLKCKVEIRFDPSMEVIIDYAEKEKNERKLLNQALQAKALEAQKAGNGSKESGKTEEKKPAEKKTYEKKENTYKREPKSENCIYGRNISIEAIPIKEINETSGYVAVLGEVFKVDTMETKTGKIILTFFITDYTDSITVKCFLKPQEKEEVLNNIKKGLYCKVRGEAIYDTYAREVVIMGRDILRMKKLERIRNQICKK